MRASADSNMRRSYSVDSFAGAGSADASELDRGARTLMLLSLQLAFTKGLPLPTTFDGTARQARPAQDDLRRACDVVRVGRSALGSRGRRHLPRGACGQGGAWRARRGIPTAAERVDPRRPTLPGDPASDQPDGVVMSRVATPARPSQEVALDRECRVEHAEDLDIPGVLANEIADPIGVVEQNTNLTACNVPIALSESGMLAEGLDGCVKLANHPSGSVRIVRCDVIENIAKPEFGFGRPDYLRHSRIRWAMSSSEMTRPASESARPRSIIRLNASSRTSSSRELSSGCCCSKRRRSCLGVATDRL